MAMITQENANNKLKKNTDATAILTLLNNIRQRNGLVLFWKLINNSKLTVEAQVSQIYKYRDELTLKYQKQSFEKMQLITGGAEEINIFIPSEFVLFRTKIKNMPDSETIVLGFPTMMAEIERRKSPRLICKNYGLDAKLSLTKRSITDTLENFGKKFDKELHDISAAGCSFMISKAESKFFEKNETINNISVNINGELLNLQGQIVNVIGIEPNDQNQLLYKAWKICVKFENMDNKQKTFLENLVFKHWDINEDCCHF